MEIADKLKNAANGMGRVVKGNCNVAVMKNQAATLEKELKNLYLLLGQQYYELYKEEPAENMKESVEAVRKQKKGITELWQKIEAVKEETAAVSFTGTSSQNGGKFCPYCGVWLEADSLFCIACGKQLEEE